MMYYIHGYLSSPDGAKGILLKEKLGVKPLKYRDCEPEDLIITKCLAEIKNQIISDPDPVLIGSSLGGLLAARTALDHHISTVILLNPAIIPSYVDIHTISGMPLRILMDMQDERLFSEMIHSHFIVFIGTDDQVVPNQWGIEFAKSQEGEVHFLHDDHRLSKNLVRLPELISMVLKRKD